MSNAYCLIRREPCYRFDAFMQGLSNAGFNPVTREPRHIREGDLLVVWNRAGTNEVLADCFERGGGTVIVAENGYIGRDSQKRQYYSLAIHGHNGSGVWYPKGPERFHKMGIHLEPWRLTGKNILICPNRRIGPKKFQMPENYDKHIACGLLSVTNRTIRTRPHPGNGTGR
jgi:hypothetical protein